VEEVRKYGEPDYIDEEIFIDEEEDEDFVAEGEDDPLLDKAIEIVTAAGKASASYLQRRLKVGYNRAARMIEIMERRGIVGPADGSKPRKVL
jgi:S-DNA-T family DNA segregation ATPase FtsK/SpoIIIE